MEEASWSTQGAFFRFIHLRRERAPDSARIDSLRLTPELRAVREDPPSASRTRGLILVHIGVLMFGVAGLFGKTIPHGPLVIVAWRTLFASVFLGTWVRFSQGQLLWHKRHTLSIALLGVLLVLHWVTFFDAIQRSSVAVGVLTFATFPALVAVIEPLLLPVSFRIRPVALSMLALVGVAVVVGRPDFSDATTIGAVEGWVSGLLYAVVTVLNRRLLTRDPEAAPGAFAIVFWQNLIGALILVPVLWRSAGQLEVRDVVQLVILGSLFTGLSHALFVRGMRHVEARTASVIATLEPIYGTLAAALIISERPALRTLIGGAIVLAAALGAQRSKKPPPRGESEPGKSPA